MPDAGDSTPTRSARAVNGSSGPRSSCATRRARRRRTSTPAARRTWRALPLHDRQPARARPVPRPVPRGGCRSRSTCRCCGSAPTRSSASTTSPRSAASGPAGVDHDAARARVALARPRRRRAALRRSRATAFCWQMVRSIVGTLVDVGDRASSARASILGILRARDRNAAGRVGAPEGLCLWEVGY